MAKQIVGDELWSVIEPLLPQERPKPKGGRPRVPDRAALTGILFVLQSGIPWEMLPPEMGCGSGMTCWRRLREWQDAGVWKELHVKLLERLATANQLDWSRVSVDAASVAAPLAIKDKQADFAAQESNTAQEDKQHEEPGREPKGKPKRGVAKLKRSVRIRRIEANRARSAMLR